jgi:hypothetical protein
MNFSQTENVSWEVTQEVQQKYCLLKGETEKLICKNSLKE